MIPETFTLLDSEGNQHIYVSRPIPAMEALAFLTSLVRVGVGPMVRFLQGSWMASPEAAASLENGVPIADLLQRLDVDKISDTFADGLVKAGGLEKLAPQLLKYTSRDGVDFKRPVDIDIAYTGNLSEMLQAIQAVWTFNGFFGALSTLISK